MRILCWVVCAGLGVGCASAAPPSTATPEPPAVEVENSNAVVESAVDGSEIGPVLLSMLLPTATSAVAFNLKQMRAFDIDNLARLFTVEVAGMDLHSISEECGVNPLEQIDRMVVSGSILRFGGIAAFESDLSAETLLDCLAQVNTAAKAHAMGEGVALKLGHQDLWASTRDGTLLIGAEAGVRMMLGAEPPQSEADLALAGLAGIASPGDAKDLLPLLTSEPDTLVVGATAGARPGGVPLPSVHVRLGGNQQQIQLRIEADLSTFGGGIATPDMLPELLQGLEREVTQIFDGKPVVQTLIRAINDAVVEEKDGTVRITIIVSDVQSTVVAMDALAAVKLAEMALAERD